MMTLKPKENFKLISDEKTASKFEGLELIVQNKGPNIIEVAVEGDKIIIEVKKQELIGNA